MSPAPGDGPVELLDLIDQLEELVVQARRLPMGGNLVVDRKRLLDLVDQIRLSLPEDTIEAKRVLDSRDALIDGARAEAQRILDEAEQERDRLLNTHEISVEAAQRAAELTAEAEDRARIIVDDADATAAAHLSEAAEAARKQLADADAYALEVLQRLEQQLQSFLDSIRLGINGLEEKR